MTDTTTPVLPLGQIRWLVGREHVATADNDIVRLLRSKMVSPKFTKALRKAAYRAALTMHHENQGLYRDVLTGRLS